MLLIFLFKLLMSDPAQFLVAIILLVLPLLISITVHEWSHGMVAYLFGDPTPKQQGRLTFNPFAHLDPIGTLMLFIVGIGWAKPVEINPNNIPGKTKQMLVALAGPASNFILAIFFSIVIYLLAQFIDLNLMNPANGIKGLVVILLHFIVQINIILAIFNMLPIPPLDGSNIVKWILPDRIADAYYSKLAPFGMLILLLLLFTGSLKHIFSVAKIIEKLILQGIGFILSPIFSIWG